MPLKKVTNFLNKIKKITPPEVLARTFIKEEIKNKTGIEINLEEIEYSPKEMRAKIKLNPKEKTYIFMKKKKILEGLKKKMGKKSPKDIY